MISIRYKKTRNSQFYRRTVCYKEYRDDKEKFTDAIFQLKLIGSGIERSLNETNLADDKGIDTSKPVIKAEIELLNSDIHTVKLIYSPMLK